MVWTCFTDTKISWLVVLDHGGQVERCKGSVELSNSRARRVNKTEDSHSVTAILISTKPYPKDCWGGSWSYQSHVLPLHQGGKEYLQTLEIGLILSLSQLFPTNNADAISVGLNDFIFMQDNAPCHKASIILWYLQQNSIPIMQWPANSPDLNPLEHL